MFDDVIYSRLARGLIIGFLQPFTAEELEAIIIRSDSQSSGFADWVAVEFVSPEVSTGINTIVHKFRDRIPEYLNMRRLWAECKETRPDLLPLIVKHEEWFKNWFKALRHWVKNGFSGQYSPT